MTGRFEKQTARSWPEMGSYRVLSWQKRNIGQEHFMKITFRATNSLRLVLLEEVPSELDLAAVDPKVFTPLSLLRKEFVVDRGLQDMPTFFRRDSVPLEVTLLDFRGNPFPDLENATAVQLAVSQLVPTRKQLFVLDGTVVDSAVGRVDFYFSEVDTDQVNVDEAIGNVRVTTATGEYKTFEVFPVCFRDSAFVLPT